MIPSPVPEIRIAVSNPQMREKIKAEIIQCCVRKDFTNADIAQIAEFREDGITLRLNYFEGAMLFGGNQLLEKELGLFPANATHTAAHLQELNTQNAAHGVTVSRVPSLDDEFQEWVKQAEADVKGKAHYKPKIPASVDDAFANNSVVAVGETHREESGRLTIATKLPELGAQKGAVVIEHLFRNRQKLMDDWLDAPLGTKMPPLLALTANAIGGKNDNYYGTKRLIEDAKESGVRVYGFETDATMLNNYNTVERANSTTVRKGGTAEYPRSAWDYRAMVMNEAAREVITDAQQRHGKIAVSAGTGHTLANEAQGIPGVADHFGGAQFVAVDGKQPGSIVTGRQPWREASQKTYPDFLLVTNDPEQLKQKLALMKLAKDSKVTPLVAATDSTPPATELQPPSGQQQLWSEMSRNRRDYVSTGMARKPPGEGGSS